MNLKELLKTLNIVPKNESLFLEALTHPSHSNEKKVPSYQRLEFFGDSLIEREVTEYIFKNFPLLDEGGMTEVRINAVSGTTLAMLAQKMNLHELILVGNNSNNIRNSVYVLEDVFEALVAAIYLDQGEKVMKQFIRRTIICHIENSKNIITKNPKTTLQEYLQSESREMIEYRASYDEKKDVWVATVYHDGSSFGVGEGKTKKEAEVEAAKQALERLKVKKD